MTVHTYKAVNGNSINGSVIRCGHEGHSSNTVILNENGVKLSLGLFAQPEDAPSLSGSVDVDVLSGSTLTVSGNIITVTSRNFERPVELALRDGKYSVNSEIVGYALGSFDFSARLPASPDEIILSFPSMLVNGKPVGPLEFPLKLVGQVKMAGMCQ